MNGTGSIAAPSLADLEVQMVAGAGAGRAFDAELLTDPHARPRPDRGVDAGQVRVRGLQAAAVVEHDEVAVPAGGPGTDNGSGRGGDHRAGPGQGGQVLPGVHPPLVVDRVVLLPEPA